MSKSTHHLPVLLMPAAVLITESEEEFNRFFDALKDEFNTMDLLIAF